MRTTYRILFYLRRNLIKPSGEVPIMLRITINGKMVQFNTQIDVMPDKWDTKQGKVIGRNIYASKINEEIDGIRYKMNGYYKKFMEDENHPTAEMLRNAYLGTDETPPTTLLEIYDKHNEDTEKMLGISISNSTYKKYILSRRRVAEFMKFRYNITNIPLKDISLNFLNDYNIFLRTEKKLGHNVAAKMMQFLKKMLVLAQNTGLINFNPFVSYKICTHKVDRDYLTKEEIAKIIKKDMPILRLEQVRDVFVFCCFCGLAYIDVKNLTPENIRVAFDENTWIMGKRVKTNVNFNVRLLDIPRKILEKYEGKLPNNAPLPVLCNQKMNAYLKEIADVCGIEKNLTFHVARHTFATLSLGQGVPIETVSKMLGHTNIKTTQIYAKITDTKISHDMELLAKKLDGMSHLYK